MSGEPAADQFRVLERRIAEIEPRYNTILRQWDTKRIENQVRFDTMQKEVTSKERKIHERNSQIETLRTENKTLAARLGEREASIKDSQERLYEMEQQLRRTRQKLQSLEAAVEKEVTTNVRFQERLDDTSNKVNEAELAFPQLKGKLENQGQQVAENTKKITNLRADISLANGISKALEARLNALDSRSGRVEHRITDIVDRLIQQQGLLESHMADVQEIRTSYQRAADLSRTLKGEKERLENRCDELERHVWLRASLAYWAIILQKLKQQRIHPNRVRKYLPGVVNIVQVTAIHSGESHDLQIIIVTCSTHVLILAQDPPERLSMINCAPSATMGLFWTTETDDM